MEVSTRDFTNQIKIDIYKYLRSDFKFLFVKYNFNVTLILCEFKAIKSFLFDVFQNSQSKRVWKTRLFWTLSVGFQGVPTSHT